MHPALVRHARAPQSRFLRDFLVGAVLGAAGLAGGLALADVTGARPSVRVVNHAGLVITSAGPDRAFGTADDIRSDR